MTVQSQSKREERGGHVEQPHEAWPIIEHEPEHIPVVPPDLSWPSKQGEGRP